MNKINKLLSKEIIRKLPKGELHFHLDGGLRVKTIMELADQQKVKLPASTYEEVKKLVKVPLDCQSLVQFLEAFGITLSVMQTKESIERIIYEACEDASNDGVRYLEIRFSPVLHLEKGLTIKEVLQAACDMIPVVEEKIPITLRYIVCGMRHLPSDVSTQLARETINFLNKGVVAFDLAGPELGFPASIHKEAYDIILEAGLLSTCHAGESDGPSSIKTAMEVGKIKRIGHGVALINDSNLLEEVKQKDMALEVCVTSNILTKFSKTYEEHPIDALYRKGLAIVPCTDNTLMCDVTLTDEYHIIHTQKGFSISDMLICMDNSFKHGFLTDKKLQNQIRLDACKTYHDVLSVEGFLDNEVSETIEKIKKQISLDV